MKGMAVKARWYLLVSVVAHLPMLPTPAIAQGGFGSLFKMPPDGQADGRYLSNNQIRTYAVSNPHGKFDLSAAVLEKAALMAQAKQFPMFAVIKKRCSTTLFQAAPMANSCYLIAQMLKEGETVKPKRGEPVEYVMVADIISARVKRLQERAGIAEPED